MSCPTFQLVPTPLCQVDSYRERGKSLQCRERHGQTSPLLTLLSALEYRVLKGVLCAPMCRSHCGSVRKNVCRRCMSNLSCGPTSCSRCGLTSCSVLILVAVNKLNSWRSHISRQRSKVAQPQSMSTSTQDRRNSVRKCWNYECVGKSAVFSRELLVLDAVVSVTEKVDRDALELRC